MEPQHYKSKKEEVADALIQQLEPIFPGIRDAIEFK